MTTTQSKIPTSNTEPTSALLEDFEEPEEVARRRDLGLRATAYSTQRSGEKGSHPDQRGCPLWCYVAAHPRWDHEIDPDHPMEAHHTTETLRVVASHYRGESVSMPTADGAELHYVNSATVEATLKQVGQRAPVVTVKLRHYPDNRKQEYVERLRLSVEDARELAVVLNHFVEQAATA